MSNKTQDTQLYCQLQEGLRYELLRGPALSGATKYQELCVAARNEDKHLAKLRRRQQYSKPSLPNQGGHRLRTPQDVRLLHTDLVEEARAPDARLQGKDIQEQ